MSTPARVVQWPHRERRVVGIPAALYAVLVEKARLLEIPVEEYVEGILGAHAQWVQAGTVRTA